jgi:DNA-binding MarR family transcriptional regulator
LEIKNLDGNNLDTRYDMLNKQVQQEIFSGHRVTDPSLFGIKQDGIFATRNQLVDSYELFNNTYIQGRQNFLERVFNQLLEAQGYSGRLTIQETEPISVQFSESTIVSVMEPNEIREKAGLPVVEAAEDQVNSKEADAQSALKGSVGGVTGIIGLLTSVKQGIIEAESAIAVLTELYGFTPEKSRATVMGTAPEVQEEMRKVLMNAEEELSLVSQFEKCGINLTHYQIISSRGFKFESDKDAEKREEELRKYGFIDTAFEMAVLDMLRENPSVTLTEIAAALDVTITRIVEAVNTLAAENYVNLASELIEDTQQRILNVTPEGERALSETSPLESSFKIAYRYVRSLEATGPAVIDTTRDFCREMVNLSLNRVWTLKEVQDIGRRENRNVWLRKGGFWTRKGTNVTTPYCRHQWEQVTIKAK